MLGLWVPGSGLWDLARCFGQRAQVAIEPRVAHPGGPPLLPPLTRFGLAICNWVEARSALWPLVKQVLEDKATLKEQSRDFPVVTFQTIDEYSV
jgi:hypothetical protein